MSGHLLKGLLPVFMLAGLATHANATPIMGASEGPAPAVAGHASGLPIIPVQVGGQGGNHGGNQGGSQGGNDGGDGGLPCRYRADPGACGNAGNYNRMPAVPHGCYVLSHRYFCPEPRLPRLKFNDNGCCHRTVKRTTMRIHGKRVRGYLYGKWHCHASKYHRHCLRRNAR